MKALCIEWTETEAGWGQRPDGYSLHKSPEAAAVYLKKIYDALPASIPEEYDYPSNGWREPAEATPVEIDDRSVLAKAFGNSDSLRVFRSFNGENGEIYTATRELEPVGEPVVINYGETPYSEQEKVEIAKLRGNVENHVAMLQQNLKPSA